MQPLVELYRTLIALSLKQGSQLNVMDDLDEKLSLIESAVHYLDTSGNLNQIKQMCEKYNSRKNIFLYTFRVWVNPAIITDINANLGNCILSSPAIATTLFQETIYQYVKVLLLLPGDTTLSQICVILRLTSLPEIPEIYDVYHYHQLSSMFSKTPYVHLRGVVTGMAATSKYTQSTKYRCPKEDCEGHTGNHFIRVHMPGASEAQTIRSDFKCTFCWTNLEEERTCRSLADKVVAEMIPEENLIPRHKTLDSRFMKQVIPVFVRGDLTKVLEIGQCFDVIGLIRKDYHTDGMVYMAIEANNIKQVSYLSPLISCKCPILPESLQEMFEDRRNSTWSFGLILAYFFGASVSPPGTYFKLKLTMLLSLLSVSDREGTSACRLLHLLAIGNDSNLLHQLMTYSCQFAHRCSIFSSVNHLNGKVTSDKYNSSPYFLEGGSLLHGTNGICYLGDLSKYNKSLTEKIQTVLRSGQVVIDISSKYTGGLPQQMEAELHSLLWAYTDPTSQKKPQHYDDIFSGCKTGGISKTLLDVYSLPQFVDSGDSNTTEEVAHRCALHQLESTTNLPEDSNFCPVTDEDFRKFINIAETLSPKTSKQADTLIQGYYLASRKARSQGDSPSHIPVTALQTICNIATSHAKLCLRSAVTEEDALMAIKLYEESVTARFGYSILSVQPTPHIPMSEVEHVLGVENDVQMKQFHTNLLRFCNTHGSHEE